MSSFAVKSSNGNEYQVAENYYVESGATDAEGYAQSIKAQEAQIEQAVYTIEQQFAGVLSSLRDSLKGSNCVEGPFASQHYQYIDECVIELNAALKNLKDHHDWTCEYLSQVQAHL